MTKYRETTLILRGPLCFACSIVCILSRGGNRLLALSINSCKDPYKELWRTATFILNLAVCDLIIGFPGELLFGLRHWFPDNPTLIQAGYFINHAAFLASILTILVLSVERLIVIAFPFTRVKLTTCNRYLCFMAIWLLALILALPTIIRWDLYLESISCCFNLICIPITILVFGCYTAIYVLVRRQLHLYVATSGERLLEGHYIFDRKFLPRAKTEN